MWKYIYHNRTEKTIYKVNQIGQIYNTETSIVIKQFLSKSGYPQVSIYVNGKKESKRVNRIVAETFKPVRCASCVEVDHIDGDKLNNHYRNLEWVTHHENVLRHHGRGTYRKGKSPKYKQRVDVKWPDEVVHEICRLFELKYTSSDIIQIVDDRYDIKLPAYFVRRVRIKEERVFISSQYNF